MANATIQFFPIRQPIDPDPDPEILYTIQVQLTQFTPQRVKNLEQSRALDGTRQGSLYYDGTQYSCQISPDDPSGSSATNEELEMFFASVEATETFTITNLDKNNEKMTATLLSVETPQRLTASDVDKFQYSFNIEVINAST